MTDNFAQTLKAQVDIVRVIGDYVRLKKSGAQNYTGLCPFHKEKSGSFSVNAVHGYFYCFGCHEKGDVFTFVMKMESVSFPEAVRSVAAKVGVAMPAREFSSPEEARGAGLRRQLLDLHEAAAAYFETRLKSPEGARAREYMTGRGLTPEAVARFRIGYAPDDFNEMRDRLKGQFSDEAMRASGLFSSKEQQDGSGGPLYARFRKRVMFPICNEQGRVIAFTGRALDSDEKAGPKYMNSPETALYSKGHVLFNLDKAKEEMRALKFALLVEGQMDCISVYMAGIKNVVAVSGTAFTEMQVRLLGRFVNQVIVSFDPDTAGQNATDTSIKLLPQRVDVSDVENAPLRGIVPLVKEEFNVRVLTLEEGLDPDRYIRERGIKAFMQALREAQRLSDYLIERARTQFGTRTPEAKVKCLNFLLPHIRQSPNRLHRDQFAADAAQKLGIDSAVMREELKQAAAQRKESVRSHSREAASEIERVLLRALLLPPGDKARYVAASELVEHPEWVEGLSAGALLEVLAHGPVMGNPLDAATDEESRTMLARVLLQAEDAPENGSMVAQVTGALQTLERRQLERRQRELRTLIAEADRRGDAAMLGQLASEKMRVDRALREL